MIAASNALRKNLARVGNTRSSKKQISKPKNNKRHPPPITFIPNENARNLPTFTIGKDSIKKSLKHGPTEPSLDFSGFVPLTRRGPLMIEDSFARPTNRIPLKPNFRQRDSIENDVNISSENLLETAGINDMILDTSKGRMKKVKDYESRRRHFKDRNIGKEDNAEQTKQVSHKTSKSNNDSSAALINYDYHPIISFFNNDY